MATVIRSAMLAGAPFLLVRRPRKEGTEQPKVPAPPAAPFGLDTAIPLQPAVPAQHLQGAPLPREATEPAPVSRSVPPVEPALDLAARDRLVREEIESAREQVLEQARREGFEEGLAKGRAALADEIESLRAVVASAGEALHQDIAGVEDVVVEIAFEAVCRIIGTTVTSPEGVAAVVRELVRDVRGREQLVVRLSPDDFTLLGEHAPELVKSPEGLKLEFVADERVELGGCIVEVAGGTLDGRLETQLKQLSDTLLGTYRMELEGGS